MAQQSSQTKTCMTCKEVNPPSYKFCGKCGASLLDPQVQPIAQTARSTAKEPVPPLPQLATKPTKENLGDYVDSSQFLIRGMGNRSQEIVARFFGQLTKRGIAGLALGVGKIAIRLDSGKTDSRPYFFAERHLGSSAWATIAVRIAPVGTDLFVEWQHYTTPPLGGAFDSGLFWALAILTAVLAVIAGIVVSFPIYLIAGSSVGNSAGVLVIFLVGVIGLAISAILAAMGKARKPSLEGFQSQDSTAFQLAVRAALEEAIDLAGISKALIQELPTEKGKERRVI